MALPLTIYLLVVGLADNIVKPLLMGRGLNTPMLVIFIGVLVVFGLSFSLRRSHSCIADQD